VGEAVRGVTNGDGAEGLEIFLASLGGSVRYEEEAGTVAVLGGCDGTSPVAVFFVDASAEAGDVRLSGSPLRSALQPSFVARSAREYVASFLRLG
jgi:hypothetical protein